MNFQAKPESSIAVIAGAIGKAALIMLVHPVWSLLSQANLSISPRIPWAALAMCILLWLLWQFLDGRIGPQRNSSARHVLLKWWLPPSEIWRWSLIAGGLAMVSMAMIETHSFQFGGAAITNGLLVGGFAQYSLLTGITFAIVTSLVAAFVEESAFRGYMQSDLERRFNRPLTIVMVALAFAIFHLYGRTLQQWSAGLADWVVISAVFSLLVMLTRSIVPAVVCHFTVDLALFSLDWFDDPLRSLRTIVPGVHTSWGAILCFITAVASVVAFAKLAKISRFYLARLAS